MKVEGGVEEIKGSWFLERSGKGQSKVGGGTGVAVVAENRGRHLGIATLWSGMTNRCLEYSCKKSNNLIGQ